MVRRLLRPVLARLRGQLFRWGGYLPADEASERLLSEEFFSCLIRRTNNFGNLTWLGEPIWQNVLDLWTIQETLCALRPGLLIECGTNRGGSSRFFATIFDFIGHGRVVTIDIAKLHDLCHPRVTYLLGSSLSSEVLHQVAHVVSQASGPVMVLLDSDHSAEHVRREMEAYHGFVTPGSFLVVQDGAIDTLRIFASGRPGPLCAIETFLKDHPEFEVDDELCTRFLITHSPKGWLRRKVSYGNS